MNINRSILENYFVLLCRNWLEAIGRYVVMVGQIVLILLTRRLRIDGIFCQLYEIGVRSLPLVSITGLAIGMVLASQAFFQLSDKGLSGATGLMVAKSMLVEIGPVLTSFLITGRVGAAICAEIGSMRVSEQIDAMICMNVDPLEYLIVPRYISMAIMMPVLTIFSSACGIFGGWFISTHLYGMNTQAFIEPIQMYITWFDLICNVVKSWIFGLFVVSIACYQGSIAKGGASGVGRATTSCVVVSYATVLGINFLLTIFLNAMYWYIFGFN